MAWKSQTGNPGRTRGGFSQFLEAEIDLKWEGTGFLPKSQALIQASTLLPGSVTKAAK